jgi:3,4-dihydroxy 2-butanone 4-phosphate synthase/GTP cyclohydrolase II
MFNTIPEAIAELKLGRIIIVCDDEDRENEGDFVALAETITPTTVNFMITHGKGLLCMPITQEIASKLNLNQMVNINTDNYSTAFTVSIDHCLVKTGISAYERCDTIKHIINPNAKNTDFKYPGHIFPLIAKNNGVLERVGHTEATVDLARLCNMESAGVICEIINPDGSMARRDELIKIAQTFNLKIITIKDLVHYRKCHDKLVQRAAEALLPTKFGDFSIYGYSNIFDNKEHVAIIKGDLKSNETPMVRIHSECLTGDVFHSLRCDCGEQLEFAMQLIEDAGCGVIIYLRQEGRGIGLINKLQAYKLQQDGYDTFDANIELGFDADMRTYVIAAQILKDLELSQINLCTNNPAKITELETYGIQVVKRIPIKMLENSQNKKYLDTKKIKFGHLYT